MDTPPQYEPPVVEDIETDGVHATPYTATGAVLQSSGVVHRSLADPLNDEAAGE